jgi:hypothetical protein
LDSRKHLGFRVFESEKQSCLIHSESRFQKIRATIFPNQSNISTLQHSIDYTRTQRQQYLMHKPCQDILKWLQVHHINVRGTFIQENGGATNCLFVLFLESGESHIISLMLSLQYSFHNVVYIQQDSP